MLVLFALVCVIKIRLEVNFTSLSFKNLFLRCYAYVLLKSDLTVILRIGDMIQLLWASFLLWATFRGGLLSWVELSNVSLNTSIACSLVRLHGLTSSLAKVNKSSGAHFLTLFLKLPNFLMFLNIRIDLLIFKTYYGQFTLTTKKSMHIIFKALKLIKICV